MQFDFYEKFVALSFFVDGFFGNYFGSIGLSILLRNCLVALCETSAAQHFSFDIVESFASIPEVFSVIIALLVHYDIVLSLI